MTKLGKELESEVGFRVELGSFSRQFKTSELRM